MAQETVTKLLADSDLDQLAYDIADLLDRNDYPLDVAQSHVRAVLPTFLEQITQNAASNDD